MCDDRKQEILNMDHVSSAGQLPKAFIDILSQRQRAHRRVHDLVEGLEAFGGVLERLPPVSIDKLVKQGSELPLVMKKFLSQRKVLLYISRNAKQFSKEATESWEGTECHHGCLSLSYMVPLQSLVADRNILIFTCVDYLHYHIIPPNFNQCKHSYTPRPLNRKPYLKKGGRSVGQCIKTGAG